MNTDEQLRKSITANAVDWYTKWLRGTPSNDPSMDSRYLESKFRKSLGLFDKFGLSTPLAERLVKHPCSVKNAWILHQASESADPDLLWTAIVCIGFVEGAKDSSPFKLSEFGKSGIRRFEGKTDFETAYSIVNHMFKECASANRKSFIEWVENSGFDANVMNNVINCCEQLARCYSIDFFSHKPNGVDSFRQFYEILRTLNTITRDVYNIVSLVHNTPRYSNAYLEDCFEYREWRLIYRKTSSFSPLLGSLLVVNKRLHWTFPMSDKQLTVNEIEDHLFYD